eukprot:gene24529-30885_t
MLALNIQPALSLIVERILIRVLLMMIIKNIKIRVVQTAVVL